MNARVRAVDSTSFRRRWLAATPVLFSLAAMVAAQMAGAAQTGFATASAKFIDVPRARLPAPAAASADADPGLERLIALHRSATRLSDAPPPPYSRN